MERISKGLYYLGIAEAVCQRSTCLRRKYGAIIVKNDQIIATGYNGAPRGETNCIDCGHCQREELNIPKGERYELCRAVHAEQNAIISAARSDMIGATIYIVGKEADGRYANPAPCLICRRMIVNAGIKKCIGMVDGKAVEIDLSKESPIANPSEPKREEPIQFGLMETHMQRLYHNIAAGHFPTDAEVEFLVLLRQLQQLKAKSHINVYDMKSMFPVLVDKGADADLMSILSELDQESSATIWSILRLYHVGQSGSFLEKENRMSYVLYDPKSY